MSAATAVQAHRPERWKSLSRLQRAVAVVLVLLAALALAAWITSIVLRPHLPTPAETTAKARAEARLTGGAQVFATHCAYCHAVGIGPAIGGLRLDVGEIRRFVRSGPGPMPAFTASAVSDADIDAVATYLNGLPIGQPGKTGT